MEIKHKEKVENAAKVNAVAPKVEEKKKPV